MSTANTKLLAESPALAVASLYQTLSRSAAIAAVHSVYAQQRMAVSWQAVARQQLAGILNTKTLVE